MPKRKLLTPSALQQLEYLDNLGVPLATAMRRLNITISRPTAKQLLASYKQKTWDQSLFPPWLDPDGTNVQEQPDNYKYTGYFPFGCWEQCENSLN